MHARYSIVVGTPVVDAESEELLGTIAGILIHPDTAKVEGFFVTIPGFFRRDSLFLSSLDILRWGTRVTVRHADVLSPLEDLVRLQSLASEHRPVLGQRMVTETGVVLGTCADVQFDTASFLTEWLFPRAWWGRESPPIPVSQVLEVRPDAIVIREPSTPVPEAKEEQAPVGLLPQMPEAA